MELGEHLETEPPQPAKQVPRLADRNLRIVRIDVGKATKMGGKLS